MKSIYFADQFLSFGGAANTLLRQAILMKNAGNEVVVVFSDILGKVCEEYQKICREAEILTFTKKYAVTTQPEGIDICSAIENYEEIRQFLQEKNPDIVHSVQLNVTVELACRELKIPHVMNIYPGIPEFFKYPYMTVFPQYHICDSWYYADFWHKYAGTKSYCVRTMAERSLMTKERIYNEPFRFICVGSIYELKNQLEVIKAFGWAVQKGLCGRLDLWGNADSDYAEKCKSYIKENHLEKNICIHGFTLNMKEVYQNSNVLICGSKRESYPNAVSEALAHNVVVISTPVAGVPEIIRDQENGYLCNGYEAENILEKIKNFLKDCKNGYIETIKENAEKAYQENHTPQAVTKQLIQCYDNILNDFTRQKIKNGKKDLSDIKEEFGGVIDIYQKNIDYFSDPKRVKGYLWKIKYVIDELQKKDQDMKYFIWGTGKYGRMYKEIMDIFVPDINLSGFIDSYKTGSCMGYLIMRPEQILENEKAVIFLGLLKGREDVISKLKECGFSYGANMLTWDALSW